MDPVVTSQQPECQVVALGSALEMLTDPPPVGGGSRALCSGCTCSEQREAPSRFASSATTPRARHAAWLEAQAIEDHAADAAIRALELKPHPEGGWYAETWRAVSAGGERPAGSAIYYLLRLGERSHWHRVDAAEAWHHYAGDPLELRISRAGRTLETIALGDDLAAGERPQAVVPAGAWQAARSLGAWSLVGCTVAPAFDFAGFELAPAGWEPGSGDPDGPGARRAPG
jgi:predicted cupin superfamily sugar epimerase